MHPRYIRYQRWQENDRAHKTGLITTPIFRIRQHTIALGWWDAHPFPELVPSGVSPETP